MLLYELIKSIIQKGNYDTEDLLNKLDVYLLADRITKEQYQELRHSISPEETDVEG